MSTPSSRAKGSEAPLQNFTVHSGGRNVNNFGMQFYGGTFYLPIHATQVGPHPSEKTGCLSSLCFHNFDARERDIRRPDRGTCDWLFDTSEYQDWESLKSPSSHNGVLWIKGKPGVGKSTLMRHVMHRCRDTFRGHLIVTYFFNARGAGLEKSYLGMLRSIAYQLIQNDDDLYQDFLPRFRAKQMSHRGSSWEWSVPELQDFLENLVRKPKRKPLILLADALDECGDLDLHSEARSIVSFLETLSINAVQGVASFRTCLSSRHFPNFGMNSKIELIVESSQGHTMDIATYTNNRMKPESSPIRKELTKEVLDRANGIFLWVVLVTALVHKDLNDGNDSKARKTLDSLPNGIEEVFEMLLKRGGENESNTTLLLQLLLLAEEPLTPKELYFAVVPTAALDTPIDTIQRWITTTSRGLAEVRQGGSGEVQFIHKSVQDFLFRNRRLERLSLGLKKDPINDPVKSSHGKLWFICWCYCRRLNFHWAMTQEPEELNKQHPFLSYAAVNIFDHAEKALSKEALYPGGSYWAPKIQVWLLQHRQWFPWWKNHAGWSSLSRHCICLQTPKIGLAYVFTLSEYRELIRALPSEIDIDEQGGVHGTALQCAAFGNLPVIVGALLERGAKVNVGGGHSGSPVMAAAGEGYFSILAMMMARGGSVRDALQAAAADGHVEIVEWLLRGSPRLPPRKLAPAFQGACRYGRGLIFDMLLARGASVHDEGPYGTALQAAAEGGEFELVAELLRRGADPNVRGGEYGTALMAAAKTRWWEVAELLLDHGADIHARGGKHGSALQSAKFYLQPGMEAYLLSRGARWPE